MPSDVPVRSHLLPVVLQRSVTAARRLVQECECVELFCGYCAQVRSAATADLRTLDTLVDSGTRSSRHSSSSGPGMFGRQRQTLTSINASVQCGRRARWPLTGFVHPAPPRRPLRSTGRSTRKALHCPARATDCTPRAMNCCPSGMSSIRSAINSTQGAMSSTRRPMNSTRSAINSTRSPISSTRRPTSSTQSAMSSTWRPIDSTRSGIHWCLSGTHSTQTAINSTLSAKNAR